MKNPWYEIHFHRTSYWSIGITFQPWLPNYWGTSFNFLCWELVVNFWHSKPEWAK